MTEVKKFYNDRFEFVFHINGHIICQRSFGIRSYNKNAPYSLEIKEPMDRIAGTNNGKWGEMGLIPKHLKKRAIDCLWNNYNEHAPVDDVPKNIYENEDFFEFEIIADNQVIGHSAFSRNMYPHYLRKQVDVKELIPEIMQDIRDTLSQDDYTYNYLTTQL